MPRSSIISNIRCSTFFDPRIFSSGTNLPSSTCKIGLIFNKDPTNAAVLLTRPPRYKYSNSSTVKICSICCAWYNAISMISLEVALLALVLQHELRQGRNQEKRISNQQHE